MKLVRESINEEDSGFKYLKPKPKEYIMKSISHLSLEERFDKAIENGCDWLVKDCIEAGINPAARDNYAIRRASYYGRTECVKVLLADNRVNPAAGDNAAIRCAAYNGHTECVKLLLTDNRVRNTLSKEDLIKYKNLIK